MLSTNITELQVTAKQAWTNCLGAQNFWDTPDFKSMLFFAFLKYITSGIKIYILKAYMWKRPLKMQ